MKLKKMITVKLIMLVLVISLTFVSSSHTQSQTGIVEGKDALGSASTGWLINEGWHNGTNHVRYRFSTTDTNLTTAMKNATTAGASWWMSSQYYVTETTASGNNIGVIDTFNDSTGVEKDTIAIYTDKTRTTSTGHTTSWKIRINSYRSQYVTAQVMAHEFGHAFGLFDLRHFQSKDKLMHGTFGYNGNTATKPTAADLKGLSVITGQHGDHKFNKYSTNPILVDDSANFHHVSCSVCDGHRVSQPLARHAYSNYRYMTYSTHLATCGCGIEMGFNHVFINNVCVGCKVSR